MLISALCLDVVDATYGAQPITYIKGRRGRNEAFHPSIRPVIHPWMASYNNPLQCEG